MGHWTLDDIAWDRFDPSKVDPDLLRVVKAAALVEHNGFDYATYLCNVFHDDQEFRAAAQQWAVEEVQHGKALARWASLADPEFDFERSFKIFSDGYRLPLDAAESVRGSRAGELIARCIVETGTSSWYTAIRDGTEEPVLKEICQQIAADELRHYKLFYVHLKRYLDRDQINRWERLRIAAGRVTETEDDELAFAYYAANESHLPYDHDKYSRDYLYRAYSIYREHHLDRGVGMIFKAVGLDPQGRLRRFVSKIAWWLMESRTKRLAKLSAA